MNIRPDRYNFIRKYDDKGNVAVSYIPPKFQNYSPIKLSQVEIDREINDMTASLEWLKNIRLIQQGSNP